MKEFYRKCSSKPKIFGMTASPIVGKGSMFYVYSYYLFDLGGVKTCELALNLEFFCVCVCVLKLLLVWMVCTV